MASGLHDAGKTALTPLEISMLELCDAIPDCTQKALVAASRRDKGQVARLLGHLERAGYLQKAPDQTNRRQNVIQVTPAARPYIEAFQRQRLALGTLATQDLSTEQRQQLSELVAHMRHALEHKTAAPH